MQVFPKDRLEGTAGDPADEENRKKQLVHAKSWRAALRTAAYFSLISAVNIGFEDFTPGDWIRRLQTRDYSLEAVRGRRRSSGASQCVFAGYVGADSVWSAILSKGHTAEPAPEAPCPPRSNAKMSFIGIDVGPRKTLGFDGSINGE